MILTVHGYQLNPIEVQKGETFSISVVAVDQASHPVDANIVSTFTTSSTEAFGEGQQTQKVNKSCTNSINFGQLAIVNITDFTCQKTVPHLIMNGKDRRDC